MVHYFHKRGSAPCQAGSATTTHATRSATQQSKAVRVALSQESGINLMTVATQRQQQTVEDLKAEPKELPVTLTSKMKGAMIVAFG
ncbi:hypothetical protein [Komagataeibacter kakiaceti]|uniref:hypothetical protein n=1 Tax=Komagataeibacter kakiaceti TaxID=943261 RepID=UPI0011DD10E1|nr:hypothetical protein [Komagataeibacter kakiaceti]